MTTVLVASETLHAVEALLDHADDDGRSSGPLAPSGNARQGVAAVRTAADLTRSSLSSVLHVSVSTVAAWERGSRVPGRRYWPSLATSLCVTEQQVAALFSAGPPSRLDCESLPALASARRRAGLTQRALAAEVGVATTTLAMWENAGGR